MSDISVQDAQHVLSFFTGEGVRGGSFTTKLVEAYSAADRENQHKLALGFPGIAAAMNMAMREEGGLDQLREIARSNVR